MPAVSDTPKLLDIEDIEPHDLTHALTIEQPPARNARRGFWRMMTNGIIRHCTPTPREPYAPECYNKLRQFEAPMDRLVREHPSLAPYILAII